MGQVFDITDPEVAARNALAGERDHFLGSVNTADFGSAFCRQNAGTTTTTTGVQDVGSRTNPGLVEHGFP